MSNQPMTETSTLVVSASMFALCQFERLLNAKLFTALKGEILSRIIEITANVFLPNVDVPR